MKNIILILIVSFYNTTFSQKLNILEVEGIWIAEDFYNSFEKNKSILKSKKAIYFNFPVGLRINHTEQKNEILNIGYSNLHDHSIHPEVSEYFIVNKDTIFEQGSYKINLNENDGLDYYLNPKPNSFEHEFERYISFKNNKIIIYHKNSNNEKTSVTNYIKITSKFDDNYQYPNPLYYYTRNRTLVGNYILKDSTNKVLSESLIIKPNGKIIGATLFINKIAHYSTDVYCGPPWIDEIVLFCNSHEVEEKECFRYIYKRIDEKTIFLYKDEPRYERDTLIKLGKESYQLIKH
ncbi:hypothetical protein [Urechidicola croceus]|uniref:Uncharacterized protein n=1 Tax=Urechidicola croceus TaxID=1850246 RepID=A0A1D8P414_9FLAO|nr:hypothetical protein [Urechidicola croceus]AOW19324.1 hypothetical protein LPB138_00900 [Urechidicola croceus]